ncbi:SDR family NAD(P)-dependent oxidoreductase [Microbacterium timonense]|uniref:SDR family NAD(P)-dependent oxidoreductase n=1 Tax=Microbacterium timonense TaxID=2086576 RepID=UPI00190ED14A|nr:3-oxoacyl-ACP reductase family protein [Microbacterium timonense]
MGRPLAGKVAIVTGAGRGLGREMAESLLRAGAAVGVAGRTKSALDEIVANAEAEGERAIACVTDVTDESSVEEFVEATRTKFGRIDIVVNNAGVLSSVPLLDQSVDDWDRIVETNLRGNFLVTKAAGRHLVAQGSGKIVNIASNFAIVGVPHHGAYAASKAGIIALTKSLAVEWARYGIQVNALAPGYFVSDINAELRGNDEFYGKVLKTIPARRMGEPSELVPWLLHLAGPESDYMTGQVLVIDGGLTVP